MATATNATQAVSPLRWLLISVFVFSSALNYLDRLLVAALAPTLKTEFRLNNTQYGEMIAVFSLVYALAAPLAGWFVDRVGLNRGITAAVSVWSLAGIATGFTSSFAGLLTARTVLGIGEAAGIPAAGKANGAYLPPREFAFGTAMNQVGLAVGSVGAPLLVAAMAPAYGWRSVFIFSGALGLLWLPFWWWTARKVPPQKSIATKASINVSSILLDRRLWALALANALVMSLYTLWTNWTTVFFVEQHHLTEALANQKFAWIPPLFATCGAFFGGWMTYRLMGRGRTAFSARIWTCRIASAFVLVTALVPLLATPIAAAALISASFFGCLAISTNFYAMPIDLFGPARAAFGVSLLTCSYGLMQTVISPLIGWMVDHFGFSPVCVGLAAMPLVGVTILQFAMRGKTE